MSIPAISLITSASRMAAAATLAAALVGCAAEPADAVADGESGASTSQELSPCCNLVKRHVAADYGIPGSLDECVDDAESYCRDGAHREACEASARVLRIADSIKRSTTRESCAVTDQVAARIEQCARYQLAETLSDLPEDERAACLEEHDVATPARYVGLEESTAQCRDPVLTGPFMLAIQAPTITGTPPNCHGTAAKIHGIDLEPLVSRDRSTWKDSRGASALPADCNGVDPKPQDLTVEGFMVNMVHDDRNPGAEGRCGEPMYTVTRCTPTPRAVLWLHGMTRQCFQKELEGIGLRPVSRTTTLVPGCVLTQSDHTLTVVERKGAMCRIYEKTTPYGINWYRWQPCCSLVKRFDSLYCPSTSGE